MTNKPVFCTEEPSFMGGAFEGDEVRSQAIRLRKSPKVAHRIDSIYFDGTLENLLGYDIVNFIDGEIPHLLHGAVVPCSVITPSDAELDALIVARRKGERVECLIVLEEDLNRLKEGWV